MFKLSDDLKLIIDYLKYLGARKETILYIASLVLDEEATAKMLDYIIETREQDFAILVSTASRISKKYRYEDDDMDDMEDDIDDGTENDMKDGMY